MMCGIRCDWSSGLFYIGGKLDFKIKKFKISSNAHYEIERVLPDYWATQHNYCEVDSLSKINNLCLFEIKIFFICQKYHVKSLDHIIYKRCSVFEYSNIDNVPIEIYRPPKYGEVNVKRLWMVPPWQLFHEGVIDITPNCFQDFPEHHLHLSNSQYIIGNLPFRYSEVGA